jgi:hypothetical protein
VCAPPLLSGAVDRGPLRHARARERGGGSEVNMVG